MTTELSEKVNALAQELEAGGQYNNVITFEQQETGERHTIDNISYETDYDRLHMQLPFLEINPIVGAVNAVLIAGSGSSKTMTIPDGAQLMRLKSIQSFYMAWQQATAITGDITDGSAPCLNPEGWYYCKGRKSISLLSTTGSQIITAEFFIQL